MIEYPIDKSWLVKRLTGDDAEWSHAIEQLLLDFREGDEFWLFDEPAPPGVMPAPSVSRCLEMGSQSPPLSELSIDDSSEPECADGG